MIKKQLVFGTILSMMVFTAIGDSLEFIGYDEQIPIFRYAIHKNGWGPHVADSCVYKFVNGKLMMADITIPKGAECMLAKNGIYVFKDTIDGLTRFQFKRNGKALISQFTLKWRGAWEIGTMAMNEDYFFVIAKRGDTNSVIFRTKYMNPVKIDTIRVRGLCTDLLDATNDFLYYSIKVGYDEDGNMLGPIGNIYRLNLKDGSNSMILKEIYTLTEAMAIAAGVNLIYATANTKYGILPLLADYSKKKYTVSPDESDGVAGVFYSYEHNTFISYQYSLDINNWKCLYPNEAIEWKSLTNQPLNVMKEKPTGPKYKNGCIGGLAK